MKLYQGGETVDSRFLKEYNKQGELIFIVDKKTAKGFYVKDNSENINIEKIISHKMNAYSNSKDISQSCINRMTLFKNISSTESVSRFLLALYCSLFILLTFTIFSGKFDLSIQGLNDASKGEFINSMKGLGLFVIGVFLFMNYLMF